MQQVNGLVQMHVERFACSHGRHHGYESRRAEGSMATQTPTKTTTPPSSRSRASHPPMAKRTHTISVRVHAGEYATLDARRDAAGIKEMGAYVRQAVLAQRPPPSVVPAVNREAWVALARTASNLNQLTAHLNAGHLPDAPNPMHLHALLVTLIEEVRVLRLALLGVAPEKPEADRPEGGR